MAKGFLDMASLTSALGAVRQGKNHSLSTWHDQDLIQVTYLLLQPDSLQIIPHLGPQGEIGDVGDFFQILPEVWARQPKNPRVSIKRTHEWLAAHEAEVLRAWLAAERNRPLWDWAASQRDLRWEHQSQTYGELFDKAFIPYMYQILGCSEHNLREVHALTTDPGQVRRWVKEGAESPEAKLARKAWVLGGILRTKYYEFFATAKRLHLATHPFRKGIEKKLKADAVQDINSSEQAFVRLLAGSALNEKRARARVRTWSNNILRARNALRVGGISLPPTASWADAEKHAFRAAKDIDVSGISSASKWAFDLGFALNFPTLVAFSLARWVSPEVTIPLIGATTTGVLVAAGQALYKAKRGRSISDELTRVAFATSLRFRSLSKSAPGRIEGKILGPPPPDTDAE